MQLQSFCEAVALQKGGLFVMESSPSSYFIMSISLGSRVSRVDVISLLNVLPNTSLAF